MDELMNAVTFIESSRKFPSSIIDRRRPSITLLTANKGIHRASVTLSCLRGITGMLQTVTM